MKKRSKLLLILLCLLLLPLTGCGNGGDSGGNGNSKTKYYEDFKFLPMYPGAKKVEYIPPKGDGHMGQGTYSIDEKDPKIALDKYKDILEKDGWTVTYHETSNYLECTRGEHSAGIVISIKKEVTTIEILAK